MSQPEYGRHIQFAGRTIHFSSLHLLFLVIGLAFLGQVLLSGGLQMGGGLLNAGGLESDAIWASGSSGPRTSFQGQYWWRGFTAMFLHVSLVHLLMNLWCLHTLGRLADQIYGPTRLLLVFLLSGLGGDITTVVYENVFNPDQQTLGGVGASGAVCGLLGLLLAHMRSRGDTIGDHVGRQLLQWSLMILVFGLIVPNVSNTAHGGGFVTGFILARFLRVGHFDVVGGRSREERLVNIVTALLCIITITALVIAALGAQDRLKDRRDLLLMLRESTDAQQAIFKGQPRKASAAVGIIRKVRPRTDQINEVRDRLIAGLERGTLFDGGALNQAIENAYRALSELDPDFLPPALIDQQ